MKKEAEETKNDSTDLFTAADKLKSSTRGHRRDDR